MSKPRNLLCSALLASSLLAGNALAGGTQFIPLAPPASQSVKIVRAKQQNKNAIVEISLLELIATTLLSNLGMSLW